MNNKKKSIRYPKKLTFTRILIKKQQKLHDLLYRIKKHTPLLYHIQKNQNKQLLIHNTSSLIIAQKQKYME